MLRARDEAAAVWGAVSAVWRMDRHYTLGEIARITGIPLEELEQYEREFADLLPRPRCCPAGPGLCDEQSPAVRAATGRRRVEQRSRAVPWRRLWQAWSAAARRVRWWPLFACGARILLWWKKWRGAFDPA